MQLKFPCGWKSGEMSAPYRSNKYAPIQLDFDLNFRTSIGAAVKDLRVAVEFLGSKHEPLKEVCDVDW